LISAEYAIRMLRRDLTITTVLKAVFIGGVGMLAFTTTVMGPNWAVLALGFAAVVGWIMLVQRSARRSFLAANSPSLIAAGQFEKAEEQLEELIKTFWLIRSVKLMGIHHLAVLRHAQRQWRESALLSEALLRQKLTATPSIARSTRLMLADALLEMGDHPGAYYALSELYAQKLSLLEAMNLMLVQLDYEAAIGAWPAMFANIPQKVQMAELLPAASAARTQALLALAAKRTGRMDWANWLTRRAELLTDINELTVQRPILKELWQ
jgi:hypothetical protein